MELPWKRRWRQHYERLLSQTQTVNEPHPQRLMFLFTPMTYITPAAQKGGATSLNGRGTLT